MSKTRCKPGDRAKVIKAVNLENIGAVVVVVRPYRDNELIDGSSWNHDGNAWVVVSLGIPIMGRTNSEKTLNRTAVFNDCCLVPLDDDDDGITRKAARTKPRRQAASKSTTLSS